MSDEETKKDERGSHEERIERRRQVSDMHKLLRDLRKGREERLRVLGPRR